jgi:hypothetical protein
MNQSGHIVSFAEKLGIAILLVALAATALMTAEAFATGGTMLQVDAALGFAQL